MSDTTTLPKTFRALLGQTLDASFRREIATAFFADKEAQALVKETCHIVASLRKMRPQAFSQLPRAARADLFLAALTSPMLENSAMQALQVWYLHDGKGIVTGFLDAWKVPHKDGEIGDGELAPLTAGAVDAAVESLRETFPAERLAGYLAYTHLAPPEASWSSAVEPALTRLLGK